MNRRSFYLSIIALSVTACSGVSNKRASGDFDYAKQAEPVAIQVPESLKTPDAKDDFAIKPASSVIGPVGKNVDVRAPSLALPVASQTRVVPESGDAIIWFDKVLEDRDLKAFIVEAIKDQLTESDVEVQSESSDGLLLESGWFHKEKEAGWIFTDIESTESMRFKYIFTTKPHGRSVSLQVSLAEYMKTDETGSTKTIDPIDQHRAEMAMLNQITSQVDYKYRLQSRENHLMRANQKLVTVGENSEGQAAYIVEMESELLWSNLPIFFERNGFTINDLNEDKKTYYVDYVKPDYGLWDKIWGDDKPVIDLDEQEYQFNLTEIENSTSLTIYDKDGSPLSTETLNRIFDVMDPALSFRDL